MISKRLRALVDWVSGTCLADIGCDHAYVPIQSILEHRVAYAYACDIAQGPLNNAQQTIAKFHLEDSITCLCMDGMQDLPGDVDCVVIAGMGGKMIETILDNAKISSNLHFLLSPHKDAPSLRRYLLRSGFFIKRERIIKDDHYYPIIDCIYDGVVRSEEEYALAFGVQPVFDEDYQSYICFEKNKLSHLIDRVPENKKESFRDQLIYLDSLYNRVKGN